jgi:hypothetical protein
MPQTTLIAISAYRDSELHTTASLIQLAVSLPTTAVVGSKFILKLYRRSLFSVCFFQLLHLCRVCLRRHCIAIVGNQTSKGRVDMKEKYENGHAPAYDYEEEGVSSSGQQNAIVEHDVFGNEEGHAIKYKTMSWQMVAVLMIAEIVSNGMLSLPSSAGVVGVS